MVIGLIPSTAGTDGDFVQRADKISGPIPSISGHVCGQRSNRR